MSDDDKSYISSLALRGLTLEEVAWALRTQRTNVDKLVKVKLLRVVKYSSVSIIYPDELRRFQQEHAGQDLSDIIANADYQEKLKEIG